MTARIAVVIPSFRVKKHVLSVIEKIGSEVWRIYVIDDCCPEESGQYVTETCSDPRVHVIRHDRNQGVGGAVMTGYRTAIEDGAEVIVKVDGDGQMDPRLIPNFVRPILAGEADYTKGNRFFDLEKVHRMPSLRVFGNAVLSLFSKISTGYWDLFDPTNGYTAIHAEVARFLPLAKISKRYFFESDSLFRLSTLRAVVVDIPMDAKYGDEVSNLRINKIIGEFLYKHCKNLIMRIFYNYYLRDMSIASMELPVGLALIFFGIGYGGYHWYRSALENAVTPAGTVVLAALPILMGLQFVLSFLSYDIAQVPRRPLHKKLRGATVVNAEVEGQSASMK